jgi:hypothetical protein
LPSSSLSGICSLILFRLFANGGKFAAGIVDTGGKFAAGIVDTVANLPPVSTRQGELVAKFAAGVLREFSKKFEMILMLLSGAWGKVIHKKNLKQKIS